MQEPNSSEWTAPPPPNETNKTQEPPKMSEVATLGNIFFEPGNTFEDLRRKPRFIMAGLIIIFAVSLFQALFIQKVGFENLVRSRIEASPQTESMAKDDKDKIIKQQSSPIFKGISYAIVPVASIIVFLLGGLIYWLGANAMGGSAKFLQGVSVWVYSSFAPSLIFVLLNVIVLLIKSADEIDLTSGQGGLAPTNPVFFVDGKSQPVLTALLGGIDILAIYGWFLAAIGLQKVAKISSGAAWSIVLILGLASLTIKVVWALVFG